MSIRYTAGATPPMEYKWMYPGRQGLHRCNFHYKPPGGGYEESRRPVLCTSGYHTARLGSLYIWYKHGAELWLVKPKRYCAAYISDAQSKNVFTSIRTVRRLDFTSPARAEVVRRQLIRFVASVFFPKDVPNQKKFYELAQLEIRNVRAETKLAKHSPFKLIYITIAIDRLRLSEYPLLSRFICLLRRLRDENYVGLWCSDIMRFEDFTLKCESIIVKELRRDE
jgi:hypothetical protein